LKQERSPRERGPIDDGNLRQKGSNIPAGYERGNPAGLLGNSSYGMKRPKSSPFRDPIKLLICNGVAGQTVIVLGQDHDWIGDFDQVELH
jgi:hypothetical protein